jgi:hypothetical protein
VWLGNSVAVSQCDGQRGVVALNRPPVQRDLWLDEPNPLRRHLGTMTPKSS